MLTLLRDILHGDGHGRPHAGGPLRRLAVEESGMLSLVTGVVILGLVVLIGLIGNIGRAARDKVELQNAADAAAYSSALWTARGMNCVTACNHLLGEMSAFCVIQESFGGKRLDGGETEVTSEVQTANDWIVLLGNLGDDGFLSAKVREALTQETEQQKKGVTAGAMLYDSRMQLKSWGVLTFAAKALANVLIASGFGATAGEAIHWASIPILIGLFAESTFLDFLEPAVKIMGKAKSALEADAGAMTVVVLYTRHLVETPGGASPLDQSVRQTLAQLDKANGVRSAAHPRPMTLGTILVAEDKPGGESSEMRLTEVDSGPLSEAMNDLLGAIDKAKRWVDLAKKFLDPVGSVGDSISSLGGGGTLGQVTKGIGNLTSGLTGGLLDAAGSALPDDVKKLLKGLTDLRDQLKGADVLEKLDEYRKNLGRKQPYPDNPSLKDIAQVSVDWEPEKHAQWTRATWPYVEQFQRPIANGMSLLVYSDASAWYKRWTPRMTLLKTVAYRRQLAGDKPRAMYIVQESTRKTKGQELWTRREGSVEAERMFSVVAVARREQETYFSPSLFGRYDPDVGVAYAQAMVYNANPQTGEGGTYQPLVGWDTLNWDPGEREYEFDGAQDVRFGGPQELIRSFPWDGPKVKLNWQAKLVPVTSRRLGLAAAALPGEFRQPLKTAPQTSKLLDFH